MLQTHITTFLLVFLQPLLLLAIVNAQEVVHDPPWFGDIDPAYFGATPISRNTSLQLAQTPDINFNRGGSSLFFVQFLYSDTPTIAEPNQCLTAAFYPRVDEFSEMTVNGSANLLSTYGQSTPTYIQVSLLWGGKLFRSGKKLWTLSNNGLNYVPARTIIVNIDRGVPSSLTWAYASCTLAACICIDDICGVNAGPKSDIIVRLGWAGSDQFGNVMTSATLDIWRFQNAF